MNGDMRQHPALSTWSWVNEETTIDADDFVCMVDQALSIYAGWADPVTPEIVEEKRIYEIRWDGEGRL